MIQTNYGSALAASGQYRDALTTEPDGEWVRYEDAKAELDAAHAKIAALVLRILDNAGLWTADTNGPPNRDEWPPYAPSRR